MAICTGGATSPRLGGVPVRSGGAGGMGGATGNSVYGADGAGGLAGFGGGVGSSDGTGGGGGSGYGGAVFVRSGGTLSLTGNSLFSGNNVYGGSSTNGGSAGNAAGSGLFIMDGANVWMAPGNGNTITFIDTIADDSLLNVPGSSIAVGQGADVHITGGGTVQFFGDNTYTGKTYIHGATLEALDGVGINSNSHVTLAGSGTIGNLSTGNAGVWLTEGTISRRIGSQPTQLSWDGSGGFAATQAGLTLNFGGNMARQALTWGSGGFVSTGSTLVFGSDAEDATGVVTLLNTINLNGQTGRIAVYNNDAQTDYAVLAGTVTGGDLIVNDSGYAGALYLTAQNSISGIVVNNGLVSTKLGSQIGRLMDAASGGSVLVNSGVLELGGAEKLTTVDVLQQGGMIAHGLVQAGTVNNAGYISFGSTTSTGAIVNSAGALLVNRAQLSASTVLNDGNWAQGGDLTLTGQFTNNGTLALMNALVNNTPTATTRTIHTSGFAGSASGLVDLDNNTLVIDQWGNSTYAGTFTGAGSLTKQGAGSLNLTGASTFTGGLTVAAGTIDTTGGGTLADNLAVQVDPNAHYIVGTSDTIGSINNAGYVTTNANLTLNTLTNSGMFNAYAGLTSTGLVDNTAAGTINLHAGSTPTFASLTNAGTILADAPLTIIGAYQQNAGTLTANANLSSGSLSGTGGMITLSGPSVHYTINQTANGTYSGAVSGGVVDKTGAANLTLNGAVHSFAPGSLNVQQGTVTAAAANVFAQSLVVNIGSQGLLDLTTDQAIASLTNNGLTALRANLTTTGQFTNNGTLALMNALVNNTPTATTRTIHTSGFAGSASGLVDLDNNTLVIDQWGNSTYAGTFTGAGSLTKQGAGSLNLTGASTFTGGLTVAAGTIDTTGGGTLADNLAVQVDPNAHYIVGTSDTIGSINNAGYVTTNANLTLNTLTNSGMFNAYAGLTSTGLVDNTAAGTINLHAGSTPTFASLTNAGTILADAPLTIIGAYQQNAGTLTANANLSSGSLSGTGGMITLSGPSVHYTINQTANGTYSGAVSGGVVDKTGAANLTLNGAVHSFAPGSLNVQQGTVTAAAANVLNDILLVNVAGAGALALNANQTIQTLTGSGLLSLGANNLTLATGGNFTGQITGTGQVLLASGQFTLTSSGTSQSNLFTVNPQSTLNVAQTSTVNAVTVNVNSANINLDGRINATTVNLGSGSTVQLGNGLGVNQGGSVSGAIASTNTYVNGGTVLKGNGSVSGLTTVGGASAGTIAPGNSPGVMTFANLTFGNNAIAAIQIDGEAGAGAVGGNDLINVTGTLTLSGSSVLALQKSLPASAYQMPLGKAIRIFNYAPGRVTGHFGSVTKTDHTPNLIFNLSDGTVVSLGNYTPASVVAATTNPNLTAILNAMPVTTAGGVPQYYGGTLLAPLLAALGSGGTSAMNTVFQQWAPDGYGDILNQMQSATLNNLPELGSYKRLHSGRIIVTGEVNSGHIERAPTETASTSAFHDTGFNTGFSADLSFARVNVSYGHSTGGFKNTNVESDINGDTVSLGVSVPVTGDQALRLTGRFLYGKYNAAGTRQTLNGAARFGSVKGDVTVYGGGLEYYRESGAFEFVGTAEYLRIKQETGAFSEAGSINQANPLDLFALDAMTQEMATAKIAARIGYRLSPSVTLYSRVSYDHDFMNDPAVIVAHNIIDPLNLTLATPGFVEDRVEGRLGLRYAVTPSLQLNLDGGIGNGNGYRFSGGARLTF